MQIPSIIQGGMGAGVSAWPLARAVSKAGHLGVVAGTALDVILVRRLQLGDPGGHMRRALRRFPLPGVAQRIVERYFIPEGKSRGAAFKSLPLLSAKPNAERSELIMAANFAEVYLAKLGHAGPVGINYLEKIQLPALPSIFGAMLAGVSVLLMGAGIPRAIPGVLDDLAAGREAQLALDVHGVSQRQECMLTLDPAKLLKGSPMPLSRPAFLSIVSSASAAKILLRKSTGRIDGLIIESSSAGGHNAPPRGGLRLDPQGEPMFGERDTPDLEAIAALGLPFWLAGARANPGALEEAHALGARGIQVGTAFAFCAESGLDPALKRRALERIQTGEARVLTDPLASPTGFPFKVFQLEGTLSEPGPYAQREKVCDLGYLRQAYQRADGRLGWRCPGEPEASFFKKGGSIDETLGRKCVCNGLLANIGLGQLQRQGDLEAPLLTSGSDLSVLEQLLGKHGFNYTAKHVLEYLIGATCSSIDA